jgi:hypothetical protein
VEASHAGGRVGGDGGQLAHQPIGLELARDEPGDPVAVVAQEASRLAQPDLPRDAQQLRTGDVPRHPDPDRQVSAPATDVRDPAGDRGGVEAELADDVRGHRRLGEHRADGLLVADQVVAFRIPGDADRVELGAARPHRLEQLHGTGELAGRLGGVAGEHEQLAHAAPA